MVRSLFFLVMIAFSITLSNGATYYMDNSGMCYGPTLQISSHYGTYYLSAWNPTSVFHTPVTGGCTMTFSAYGGYGTKYKFSGGGYITSSGVKLNVYAGSSTYGTRLGSYTWTSRLPTTYTYTHNGYITVELVNPSNSKNFDFTIQVNNYDYSNNGYVSDFTAADTVGVVVGVLVFVIVVTSISVYVRIRRRRFLLANAGIAAVSVATVTTSSGHHHHHHHHSGHH